MQLETLLAGWEPNGEACCVGDDCVGSKEGAATFEGDVCSDGDSGASLLLATAGGDIGVTEATDATAGKDTGATEAADA